MPAGPIRRDVTIGSLSGGARVTGSPFGLQATLMPGVSATSAPSLLIGSRVSTAFNTAPWNTISGQEGLIGPIQVTRAGYFGSLPTSWTDPVDSGDQAGMPTMMSCTSLDSNLTSWCNSIKNNANADALADAGHIWLCYIHEPENNKISATSYITNWSTFHSMVKSAEPRIKIGPIAFTYAYGRGNNATALAGGWIPDPSLVDFYGADVYMPYTDNQSENGVQEGVSLLEYGDFTGWYNLIKDSGKEIIFPEWGMYAWNENGGAAQDTAQEAARANLIPQWVADMRSIGATAMSYWNVGQQSGERGTYMLVDSASQAAYTAIVRAS